MSRHPSREHLFPVEAFSYDPQTGVLTRCGKPVGTMSGAGYLIVQAAKVRVLVHRLAWRLHFGEWPTQEIDHVNRDTTDNRISNLRQASPSENKRNRSVQSNCASGVKNLYFDRVNNRWQIAISDTSGKRLYFRASHKLSGQLAAPLIRRTLHGEFAS
jgi:hypothetical protein